jgi:hypothetical protein
MLSLRDNISCRSFFFRRLRTLTETLVAKQAVLEAVQSERSSLLLQLERANKERSGIPSETENSTRVLLNITDDGKAISISRIRGMLDEVFLWF